MREIYSYKLLFFWGGDLLLIHGDKEYHLRKDISIQIFDNVYYLLSNHFICTWTFAEKIIVISSSLSMLWIDKFMQMGVTFLFLTIEGYSFL